MARARGFGDLAEEITEDYLLFKRKQGGERYKVLPRLYAIAPDGGNEGLKTLLREKDAAHAKHFQFSILEICDPMMQRDEVIARENHWKQALCSRNLGHNKN